MYIVYVFNNKLTRSSDLESYGVRFNVRSPELRRRTTTNVGLAVTFSCKQ